MKFKCIRNRIRIMAMCLAMVLFFVSVCPSYATENIDDLEDSSSRLESEVSDLEKELSRIQARAEDITDQLKTTRKELAVAKGNAEAQYDSMMVRIKYMYENGNSTMLEMLFSSSCVAEFLSRAEFISAITEYDRALLAEYKDTLESITAKESELEEMQKELVALQDDLDNKLKNTSTELSECKTKLEEAKKLAEKEVEPIVPSKPPTVSNSQSNSSIGSTTVTETGGVTYTEDDVTLLAALIECEAGSKNYEALLAVGAVVVNRMKSRYYPDTLTGVIYQNKQFPPATDGKVDRVLARGVKSLCVTAARDALNGKSNVGDCVRFRAASSNIQGTVIGDNVFF